MTTGTPDPYLWRRVAALERQIAAMEGVMRRVSSTRRMTPLNARLWMHSGNNLYDINGTDTLLDVTVESPGTPLCLEQIDLRGKRHFLLLTSLIGGCLAEDHPGRGEKFTIHLGTWDASDASGGKWVYDLENTVAAIDWRYDVPYPDEGSTGLFEARSSDTYDVIYETVALDCTSPGECEGAGE